jgi:hypothetical protein
MVTNLKDRLGENLFHCYTRFRGLPDHCTHHELLPWLVIHTFYGGLSVENRIELENASHGSFMECNITKS